MVDTERRTRRGTRLAELWRCKVPHWPSKQLNQQTLGDTEQNKGGHRVTHAHLVVCVIAQVLPLVVHDVLADARGSAVAVRAFATRHVAGFAVAQD
ncbi:hypothetical protein FOA52_007390 [Chlamydomonas sp. UWO 241]|nr:hypothetical protein FOA52_007390 [Chlamydomonas sp. UWO 241]